MGRFTVIDSNIIDKQGILNLLKNFIFGNSQIEIYDQDKIYNKGDKVYVIDSATGDIKVVTAIADGITGPYNSNKWNDMTLTDSIERGLDDVIVISPSEPTSRLVQMWLTPNGYSTHLIPAPIEIPVVDDENSVNIVFINGAIPIVEDVNNADLDYLSIGDLVFDWEGEGEIVIPGVSDIESGSELIVDEQDDVEVSDDEPGASNVAFIWIDTDLTDDSFLA